MDIDVVDVDHVTYRVSDVEEARHFYHDLLGLEMKDQERFERGEVPFLAFKVGGRHLHFFPEDDDSFEVTEETYGHEHLCLFLRTDDRDPAEQMKELLAQFQEEGVQIDSVEGGDLHGHDVESEQKEEVFAEGSEILYRNGAYGHGVASYIRDPDGRIIELKMQ